MKIVCLHGRRLNLDREIYLNGAAGTNYLRDGHAGAISRRTQCYELLIVLRDRQEAISAPQEGRGTGPRRKAWGWSVDCSSARS